MQVDGRTLTEYNGTDMSDNLGWGVVNVHGVVVMVPAEQTRSLKQKRTTQIATGGVIIGAHAIMTKYAFYGTCIRSPARRQDKSWYSKVDSHHRMTSGVTLTECGIMKTT